MKPFNAKLLSTTVIPMVMGVGLAVGGLAGTTALTTTPAFAACGAKKPCSPCAAKANPCAAAKTNPCAAKNPCAAAKANPCNPCAAKKK